MKYLRLFKENEYSIRYKLYTVDLWRELEETTPDSLLMYLSVMDNRNLNPFKQFKFDINYMEVSVEDVDRYGIKGECLSVKFFSDEKTYLEIYCGLDYSLKLNIRRNRFHDNFYTKFNYVDDEHPNGEFYYSPTIISSSINDQWHFYEVIKKFLLDNDLLIDD